MKKDDPGSTDWEMLEGGYAVPRRFTTDPESVTTLTHETLNDPDVVKVQITVEVVAGRARAAEVCVSTDRPLGVGSVTLKTVPVRLLMVNALADRMHRVAFDEHSEPTKVPVPDDDDKAQALIRSLVGYVPEKKAEATP